MAQSLIFVHEIARVKAQTTACQPGHIYQRKQKDGRAKKTRCEERACESTRGAVVEKSESKFAAKDETTWRAISKRRVAKSGKLQLQSSILNKRIHTKEVGMV